MTNLSRRRGCRTGRFGALRGVQGTCAILSQTTRLSIRARIGRMAWKTERWLEELFPGEEQIYSEYNHLPPRELAIVSCAVLDAALVDLLALRLKGGNKEITGFLGVNGDGRAPTASFGARIQLGLLVGLLTPDDARILRTLKDIRNQFAHRVKLDFLSPSVLRATTRLFQLWSAQTHKLANQTPIPLNRGSHLEQVGRFLPHQAEAGEGLFLAVFTVYHAYFHRMHPRVEKIGPALAKKKS